MKLVITKAPKNISVLSKMGCMVRFGDLVGIVSPTIQHKFFKTPDIDNSDIVGLLEKHRISSEVKPNKFIEIPNHRTNTKSDKVVFLKVYIGKPDAEKIHQLQAALWPINPTTYLGVESIIEDKHDFSGFESTLSDLDVIDFGDLPPYVHLLVEQLINKESVGYAPTSHVLQEIEDRAYQMTV